MKKYIVTVSVHASVNMTINAKDKDDARVKACKLGFMEDLEDALNDAAPVFTIEEA